MTGHRHNTVFEYPCWIESQKAMPHPLPPVWISNVSGNTYALPDSDFCRLSAKNPNWGLSAPRQHVGKWKLLLKFFNSNVKLPSRVWRACQGLFQEYRPPSGWHGELPTAWNGKHWRLASKGFALHHYWWTLDWSELNRFHHTFCLDDGPIRTTWAIEAEQELSIIILWLCLCSRLISAIWIQSWNVGHPHNTMRTPPFTLQLVYSLTQIQGH